MWELGISRSVAIGATAISCWRRMAAQSAAEERAGRDGSITPGDTTSDAARALCALLAARHPSQGFLLHPALRFEQLAGDVCVRAARAIEKGEILLAVPERAMVAVSPAEGGRIPLGGRRATQTRQIRDRARARFFHKP